MTIEFQVCPYHEPHPAGFERTLVVDTFTRRFKCAACDMSGEMLEDGGLQPDGARIGKLASLANAGDVKPVDLAQVYEDLDVFWKKVDAAPSIPPIVGPCEKVTRKDLLKRGLTEESLSAAVESAQANGDVMVVTKCFEGEDNAQA